MPRGKHVKIVIASDGTCSVDAVNFTGPACQAATSEITAALGGQVGNEHIKPEARIRERCREMDAEGAR